MSKDNARNFHNMIEADAGLRAEVRVARDDALAKMVQLGKDNGFEFTGDDLHAALKEKWGGKVQMADKLDDEDDTNTCVFFSERPGA